ncbi:MAG: VOC family protein [bacterium]|nr:VOC family protein [bacterium]
MFTFNHFNINVLNLERSLAFYKDALGLTPCREINPEDGSFKIVYLSDGASSFVLELTWLRDRTEPYNLGDEEFHLAFTAEDFEAAHAKHAAMGCICFENEAMGIYFIQDPDGYWLEVIPPKK